MPCICNTKATTYVDNGVDSVKFRISKKKSIQLAPHPVTGLDPGRSSTHTTIKLMSPLLLPVEHRAWVETIKYVIFDEVHCMNEKAMKDGAGQGQGQVWERLLSSIR